MENHSALIKTENKEILMSTWDSGLWNEFPANGKMKLEQNQGMSISDPINKSVCFTQSDTIINDKTRLVREYYKCDQCLETLTSKQTLKQHKDSVHNDKKTFRCTVGNCVRAFTSANYLKNHTDIEHTDCSESRLPCPKKDCGLVFPNNYRLKRHIRQDHRQEKLYQCQICARKFVSLEVRNNHMSTKHSSVPVRDNFALKMMDGNYYRTEISKESENDTVYAASPISSRFDSLNGPSSIDTTCEAQWLTKASDSNPSLSKQIDRILCDIFSDRYQETPHSPLSSSELAIAILSLEETNEECKRKQAKVSPHLSSLISVGSSPVRSSHLFNESDKKLSSTHNLLLSSNQYNHQNNVHNVSMSGQNYPQSNTESEGHSTESQRSFLINSSQHEEFSDISMDSHMKDVFSSAVEKWNIFGNGLSNSSNNPIKLVEYTCLDTMFDDFHEIIGSETNNAHHFVNGHSSLVNNLQNIPGQKNHLLSLNNMHSKFLGGSQLSNTDQQSIRPNTVPSNQLSSLSNYELNRRKVTNRFPSNGVHIGSYDIASACNMDPNIRDSSFTLETISPRCHVNPLINGAMCQTDGRMMANYPQNYQYGSNQQLLGANQMYYNRDVSMYIQQPERSPYHVCANGSTNPNMVYHNSMETELMNESLLPTNQYSNVYRRRAPPPPYQAGFSHQMLPSQHSAAAAAASLAYCTQPVQRSSSSNCFHPQTRSLYADSTASMQLQQQQHQRQLTRHLLSNAPMDIESQGQQSNSNHAAVDIDSNPVLLECENSILDRQQTSIIVNEQSMTVQR